MDWPRTHSSCSPFEHTDTRLKIAQRYKISILREMSITEPFKFVESIHHIYVIAVE